MASPDVAANRAAWDAWSDEYQAKHRDHLAGAAWGAWQIPESELRILGDVAGKDVLELGCGAAQWSLALARLGARCVGLDNSGRQLEHARAAGADFPLIHASAEEAPLPDGSFDVVFCDHGAFTWADPHRVVPEAARLLRPGGLLAFCASSPLRYVCYDDDADRESDRLRRDYFGLHRFVEGDGSVSFCLEHGEWIRLFGEHGLGVERLVELRAPEGATTTYGFDPAWARRWPAENVWVARKRRRGLDGAERRAERE